MTAAQEKFYWKLWGMVRKAAPETDRKELHRALDLPESHREFSNADFDTFKGRCLALAQPGNFKAQVQQLKMPAIRKQIFIGHLLTALVRGEEYAEAILAQMNVRQAMGGPLATLDTLAEDKLEKLMVALKKECRRVWKTKEHLLGEIWTVRADNDFPELETAAAVMKALAWQSLPPLDKLYYEPLLVVLSVLRRLAAGQMRLPPIAQPAGHLVSATRGDADERG